MIATTEVQPTAMSRRRDEEAIWKDRRAHERRELVARATLAKVDGSRGPGITENVSEGGCFVGTLMPAIEGEVVSVSFELPGGAVPVVARAEVMRVRSARADRPEMMPGLGLRFIELDDEDQRAIGAYIARRVPRFAPS